jgi:hypothetical protein
MYTAVFRFLLEPFFACLGLILICAHFSSHPPTLHDGLCAADDDDAQSTLVESEFFPLLALDDDATACYLMHVEGELRALLGPATAAWFSFASSPSSSAPASSSSSSSSSSSLSPSSASASLSLASLSRATALLADLAAFYRSLNRFEDAAMCDFRRALLIQSVRAICTAVVFLILPRIGVLTLFEISIIFENPCFGNSNQPYGRLLALRATIPLFERNGGNSSASPQNWYAQQIQQHCRLLETQIQIEVCVAAANVHWIKLFLRSVDFCLLLCLFFP